LLVMTLMQFHKARGKAVAVVREEEKEMIKERG
jgi:hypothetical protein